MSMKIAVITSQFLRRHTEASLERLSRQDIGCETLLLTYKTFACLPDLYDQYAEKVDGFLVSGQVTLAAIEGKKHAVRKPIMYFQADTTELYKSILCYLLEHPGADISRIILDFLLPLEGGPSAEKLLREMELPVLEAQVNAWIRTMEIGQLERLEAAIAERIMALWTAGKVDIVICLFSSIAPLLKAHGIPCDCPRVEDAHLMDLIHRLQMKIELERLRAYMPAAVNISPRGKSTAEQMGALHQYLAQFLHENLLECVLQEESECCYLFTTVSVMHYLTDHCRSCKLSAYLDRELPFPTAVGYGVGSDISCARLNAQVARKEAEFSGKSFIRNERGELIGPLGTEKSLIIRCQSVQNVGEIAKRCGLSTLTIQKVAASMKQSGSSKMTNQELANRFGVTVRNANRILNRLVEGGYAQVVYVQAANSKGRPVKVYELMLNA